ncbi:MAG: HDOD domain-containing protein [Planctomycetota bacterium]|nr:MAG: HDOD domain-containing protein [Planctomycetota bacterium]
MPEEPTDATVAPQVELVIRRLDSLSILPCVAAQFLSLLLEAQPSMADLADIIESEPALSAKIFSLMHEQGLSLADEKPSIRQALDKLPLHLIRGTVLSVKAYPAFGQDSIRASFRTQLTTHCLAVACCAKDIAEVTSVNIDSELAYSAGLLHDIGKLALDEAMPRSFSGIIEQAKSQLACSCSIEQKHLGLDHTILGKRLAAKWHLPNKIALGIWLHHSDTKAISQSIPEARIAQIVQLADLTARQCNIGQSGSYDTADASGAISQALAITAVQLEQIRRILPDQVSEKCRVLGMDLPRPESTYCDIVQTTAAQLAKKHMELSAENRQMQTALSHSDFATDFLLSINPNSEPIDMAENLALRWQKFYQTGVVCLYLTQPAGSQFLQAVVVDDQSQAKTIILNAPAETPAVPEVIASNFAIVKAADYINWLFEQLAVDFDLEQTKLVPLLSSSKAIGAIAFELRHPVETEHLEENLKAATFIASAILDMSFARVGQQRFAEQLAQLLATLKNSHLQLGSASLLGALAEMAGGAAHELNNPLSVISGRAQILAENESDPEKKRMLEQIRQNASEISTIVDDLMTFAKPPQPRPTKTNVRQILDEAMQLTAQKQKAEQLDIKIEVADGVEDVLVDSAQVVSAIANILCNCLESYSDEMGPIKVTTALENSGEFVKLQIIDTGCGMDVETVRKASQPFFSAKPAGRKRGMGLAHAHRIIQLNKGTLNIASQPGSGTTVTICLPCK